MSNTIATPLSKIKIKNVCMAVRRILHLSRIERFDVVKMLDKLVFAMEDYGYQFNYEVRPDDDSIFNIKEEALTELKTGTIYIKQSVMDEACSKKNARAIFTLAHELGHYFLHYFPNDVSLARVPDGVKFPIFMDAEWQADNFAAELLMPEETCRDMSIEGIMNIYNVSGQAATTKYNKLNGIKTRIEDDFFE